MKRQSQALIYAEKRILRAMEGTLRKRERLAFRILKRIGSAKRKKVGTNIMPWVGGEILYASESGRIIGRVPR